MPEPIRRPALPPPPLDLTRAILARTSGDPCQRLQHLACDFVDGHLDAGQAGLARLHLGHCEACSALVAALATLQATLPTLAQAEPGPWFTQRVLRATRQAPDQRTSAPRPANPGDLWRQLMRRPRIALEAAYLGAAAGLMGIHLPLPVPDLDLRVPALVQPLGASAQRVASRLEQVAQAERRTAQSLQEGLRPLVEPGLAPLRRGNLWQRLIATIRTRVRALRGLPPTPPPPWPPAPANSG